MPVPIPVSPSSDESNPINESGISALALQSSIPGKQAMEAAYTLIDLHLIHLQPETTFSLSMLQTGSYLWQGQNLVCMWVGTAWLVLLQCR